MIKSLISLKGNLFYELLNTFQDFIAPRYCEICKVHLDDINQGHTFICDKCFDKIPLAPEPAQIFNRFVSNFDRDDLSLSGAISLFSISESHDFMNLIYSLKYNGFSKIGFELGKELGRLMQLNNKTDYDYLVPVPIHHARMRERGYNQSEKIADGISDVLGIEISIKAIKRKKYTQTQTVLSKTERRSNVMKVISPYNEKVNLKNKNILLVDDVLTTGSTLNACASVLMELGAKSVEAATLVFA